MKEETYKRIDIPFDAENIEMDGYSLNIPEGFEAVIENNKVVIKRKINKIKESITYILANTDLSKISTPFSDMLKWLETAEDNFNFINKIQIGDKVTRNKDGALVNLSQLNRVAKKNEKQGEQKPAMIQWKGNNLKEVIDFTGKAPQFDKWFKTFDEYEQYVHEHNNLFKLFNEDGSHYEVPVGAWIVRTPDGYNVASKAVYKQNSAWSKEDKKLWLHDDDIFLDAAKMIVADSPRRSYGGVHKKEIVPWFLSLKERLKSLKERVQPQPKQEWSKEDKKKLNRIYSILGQAADTHAFSTTCRLIGDKECIELQDFLRDITKPQINYYDKGFKDGASAIQFNKWKPSEEQMKALQVFLAHGCAAPDKEASIAEEVVDGLYNDLKKLMEE